MFYTPLGVTFETTTFHYLSEIMIVIFEVFGSVPTLCVTTEVALSGLRFCFFTLVNSNELLFTA